jgi:hypothetical protein
VLDLEGEEYSRVIVSTSHATKLIAALRVVDEHASGERIE